MRSKPPIVFSWPWQKHASEGRISEFQHCSPRMSRGDCMCGHQGKQSRCDAHRTPPPKPKAPVQHNPSHPPAWPRFGGVSPRGPLLSPEPPLNRKRKIGRKKAKKKKQCTLFSHCNLDRKQKKEHIYIGAARLPAYCKRRGGCTSSIIPPQHRCKRVTQKE